MPSPFASNRNNSGSGTPKAPTDTVNAEKFSGFKISILNMSTPSGKARVPSIWVSEASLERSSAVPGSDPASLATMVSAKPGKIKVSPRDKAAKHNFIIQDLPRKTRYGGTSNRAYGSN